MSKAIGLRGDVFTAVVYGYYDNQECIILGIREIDPIQSLKLKHDIQFQLKACYPKSFVYTSQFTDNLVKTMYPDVAVQRIR